MASNNTNLLSYGIVGQKFNMGLRAQIMVTAGPCSLLEATENLFPCCLHPLARNSLTPSSKPTILYLFNHYFTVRVMVSNFNHSRVTPCDSDLRLESH